MGWEILRPRFSTKLPDTNHRTLGICAVSAFLAVLDCQCLSSFRFVSTLLWSRDYDMRRVVEFLLHHIPLSTFFTQQRQSMPTARFPTETSSERAGFEKKGNWEMAWRKCTKADSIGEPDGCAVCGAGCGVVGGCSCCCLGSACCC